MENAGIITSNLDTKVVANWHSTFIHSGFRLGKLPKTLFLSFFLSLISISSFAFVGTWFSQGTSDPSVPANWNSLANGTGVTATATDFTTAGNTWQINTSMTLGADWAVVGSISIASTKTLNAGSFTITVGNNWANSGTFTCGTGTVIFNATTTGHTLTGTLTGATGQFYNLTFNGSGGAWSMAGNTTTVTGAVNITAGTLTAPSTTLNIAGNFSCAGTFTHNSGTVNFNGGVAQTLPSASISYMNFTTANSGTSLTANGTIVINNNLTIASGTILDMGANVMTTITSAGITNNGTVKTQATATAFPVGLNWTSNLGTGTVVYNAASTQSVIYGTYYNLTIGNGNFSYNASGSSNNFTINGLLTINSGSTFNLGSDPLLGSTLTTAMTGATLETQSTNNPAIPASRTWGGTVLLDYSGASSTYLPAGTYNNITVNVATTTLNFLGSPSIGGNLNISTTSGTVNFNGNITIGGSVSLTGTSTNNVIWANDHDLNVGGDWTVTSSTATTLFKAGVGTVNFNGSGTQTISSGGGSALPNFYNLTNSNTTGTLNINNNTTLLGAFTNNANASVSMASSTSISAAYNWINNGNFSASSSTVTLNGGVGAYTVTGSLTGANKFNNLTISNSHTATFTSSADVGGNFSLTAGTVVAPSGTLSVAGNFAVSGTSTFSHNNGTVTLNGGGGQSLPGLATAFYNLNIANTAGTITANSNITVNNSILAPASGNLNMATFQLLGTPTATSFFGTLQTQYTGGTAISAGLSWGTGSTVIYNSTTTPMLVAQGTYYNLTITGTTGTRTLGATSATTVNGNLVIGNSSTTGLTTLNQNLTVLGNVTLTSNTGTIFDVSASNFPISVGGDWTQSSSDATNPFNPRSGLVTFTGAAGAIQTLSVSGGTGTPSFYDLTDNNTSFALNVNASTAVSHTFSVSASALVTPLATVVFNPGGAGSSTLQGSGTIQITRITSTPDLNTQYTFNTRTLTSMTADYTGAGNQNVNAFTYGTLKTSNSGIKTAQGAVSINNALNVSASTTLDMGTNLLSTGGSPTYTVNGTLKTSVLTATSATPIPSGATWGGTGTIELGAASGAQTLVSGTFYNVTLDNTTGTNAIGTAVTINNTLTLGNLTLGANTLTLGSSASITGASSSNYIIAIGAGKLRKNFSANGTFAYPVGDATNYTPISITESGSAYSSAYLEANVTAIKHPNNGSTTDFLKRYWTVVQSGVTGSSYDATATYVAGDVNGTESAIKAAFYKGSLPWNRFGLLNTGAKTLTITGNTFATSGITGMTGNNPSATFSPSNPSVCSGNSVGFTATGVGDPSFTYAWAPSTGLNTTTGPTVTASPTVTTVYTVTITDGNGLTGTSTNTVTVNVSPSSTGATNNGPTCVGNSVILSDNSSNATIWSWTGPSGYSSTLQSPTITPTVTGTYSLTVSNAGCSNATVYTTTVTINQAPTSTGITNNGPICNGGTVTLTANSSNTTGWTWVGSDGFTSTLQNPTATPSSTTTYSLTLSNPSCTNATVYTTTVTVNPAPSLSGATNNSTICSGATLTLSANSPANVTSYLWNGPVAITSSTSASASVPSATTAASGTYTVTVNNGSGSGCSVNYTTTATVNAAPSLASANNDGPICAGTTLNLSVTTPANITAYLWNGPVAITNSTSASASVPSATTGATGTYTVTVNNGSGTGCSVQYTTAATVSPVPTLSSATNDGPLCAGTTLNLTANGAANVTGYLWNGPVAITTSTSASASVPSATIGATGTYTVTVNNGSGTGCTARYTTTATVSPVPSLISANNDGPICAGTTLHLTVSGASNVTGYLWNGPVAITTSTSASASVPSATTGATGTYTVTVNNGSGTGCTAQYTTAATVSPVPTLTSATNDGPICAGTTLNLSANGAANVTGYLWNGPVAITNSTSASASVPSSTTSANGTYTVTVNNGSGTGCTAQYTTAATVSPVPSLTSANNDGPICAGTTLHLTVSGASNVTGYSWAGPVAITTPTSASASVPSATTGATGTYTVTVNNGSGTGCTAQYTTAATVSPVPTLTSATNDGPICAGTTLNLTANGASNVTGYLWAGPVAITTATSASASVPTATTGATGTYTVTVNNGSGTGCTAQYTTTASVNPAPSLTSANNDGPICAGTTLNLTVSGASNVTSYSWSGPVAITNSTSASASVPSATTAASGVYTVTVSGLGCSLSYTTSATVSPVPSLTSANNDGPICSGTTLHLTVSGASNVTGYLWNGPVAITTSTSASASVPSATTGATGTYTVTVNNGSGTGCTAQYTTAATVSPAPSLTSATNDGPICAGTTLNLTANGASNVTGYLWNGPVAITTSTSASASVPSATTGATGTYTVTVNNGSGTGCTAQYTTAATVSPVPSLTSANNDGPICAGTTLHLTVSGASNITGYLWNGPVAITTSTSASASVPSATTGATGTYTVTVNNGSGTGCTAQYTTAATVSPAPSLTSATNDGPICAGITLNLTANGASNVTGYLWKGPVAITTSTSASASVPSATTGATGTYTVTVNNGSGTGCTAQYTTAATVSPVPSLTSANNDGPICTGTTLHLTVSGASNITGYLWNGPVAITTSTSASASVPSATTGATGTYTVTVNNGSGTGCTAQYTTAATVSPVPSLTSATNDGPICAGTTLNLSANGASNVTGYLWNGPVAITSSTSASASVPSATTGATGTYTVTVNNGSGTGCTAQYTTVATVSPVPSLTSANNDGPICALSTLHLSVSGASNVTGYLWNGPVAITNSTSASATVPSASTGATGTYTVTVNNGSGTGCTAQYTTSATISPSPSITSANNDGPICAGTTLNLTVSGAANVSSYLWSGPVAITNSTSSSASVPSATTSASGVYTVTLTGLGCTVSYTTAATVSPVPSLSGANNDGPICAGTTLNLTVSGASNVTGYLWNGPVAITNSTSSSASVPSATTGATGTYTVTVNNGSGTGCTAQYTTAATVSPVPTLTGATNDGPICAGYTLNLTANGASNVTAYSWAGPVAITTPTSATASVPTATTGATGTYTVTVNNGSGTGCSAQYTTTATVSPAPSLTSANNDGPICAGTTLNLTVSGASNVTSYLWNGPVAITNSTSASASVPSTTTAANGVYTVTVTGLGCSLSYTTSATVSPVPTLTSANNDGPICAGTTLNLSVSGASNVTGYSWAGPVSITTPTSSTASVPSAITGATGTYTVTVNNGSGTGCTAQYTTTATVSPVPTLTSANNDGPICAGTTLNLSVTGANNVTGYLWNGPVAITNSTSAGAGVPSTTTSANGTYTVTVNNGSGTGCTANYTTAATVSPVPTLTSANNDGPICAGTTLHLSVSGASNVTGYLWNGPVAITTSTSATASVPSATTSADGTYTVTVNNGSGTGCTAQYTTTATVSPVPTLTSATNDGPVCVGGTLNLAANGATNVTGYLWNGPVAITNSTSSSSSVASVTLGSAGTYTVTVNNGSGTGCTARYTTTPTINPAPSLTSANNNGPFCSGTTLLLTVSGASNVTSYLWNGPVAITNSTSASASVPSATPVAAGVYTVTVNNGSGSGCAVPYTTTAVISPIPSITSADNNAPICAGATLNLTVTSPVNVTGYSWSGPAAITNAATASASVPSASTSASGIYSVTVSSGAGCANTYTTSVTVNTLPIAAPSNSGAVCQGNPVNLFANPSGGASTFSWSGPNLSSTTAQNPVATPSVTTVYSLTVTNGTGNPGCSPATVYTTTVIIYPMPGPITGATSVCVGASTNLGNTVSGGLWTSSLPGVATVNCNLGTINGISTGSSVISYTLPTGCFTTTTVNVISLASITGASVLCTGSNTTLSDATPGGQWVSNNSSVATIGSGTGVVTGIAPGNATISYLYGSGCMVTSFLSVLTIPSNTGATSVCVGGTATIINATEGGTWTSSNTSAATIAPSTGLITGINSGSTIITYSFGSACITTNTITVNNLPAAVSVTGGGTFCGSATISASGGSGGTIYFQGTTSGGTSTATASSSQNVTTSGTYYFRSMSTSGCWGAEGSVNVIVPAITGPLTICTGTTATLGNSGGSATWTSSNTAVATIDTATGYISALTDGSTTITSTTGAGCVVTAVVTVGLAPAISGPTSVCAGQTITLSNSGLGGSWTSASPTIATVSSTGVVTGIASYLPATISYTFNSGCVATYVVTVNPLSPISIPSFVCAGQSITLTNSVSGGVWSSASAGIATIGTGSGIVTGVNSGTALISYVMPTGCVTTAPVLVKVLSSTTGPTSVCAGQSITLSNATPGGTWTSSLPTIANINSVNGVATGVAGISVTLSAPISYSLGSGCIAVYTITVNPLPSITGTTNICQGAATTLYNPAPGGTWSSENASIATINSGGVAAGVGSGIVTISYLLPTGCLATIPLNVNPVAPIQGSNVVCQGQTITLVDTAGAGTWSSSAPTIASVGSLGVVTGLAPYHTADITYTFCTGCTAQITLTVTAISAIDITGPICQGDITTLTNTGVGGVWSSTTPAVAFFGSTNGNITGVSAGTTSITYSIGTSCFAYATVTVNALAPIVGASSVCNGATITLTDATFGGTWSSSAPTIASVGVSTGIVTGNAGSNVAIITYTTPQGCRANKTVTVNPLNPITGPTSVCLGLTIPLANSTPGGGTWLSSAPGIASVVAGSGVVTGVTQGTATISFTSSLGCINTTVITVNINGPISGSAAVCVGQSVTLTNSNAGGTWYTPNTTMITVGSASGVVTGLVGGTFPVVTYSQPGGCQVAYTMTVNALASITGPTSVCPGQTITAGYLPSGPNWSSSTTSVATIGTTGIITGVTAGTTTISYTNASGCIATEVVTVSTGSPITGASSVCNGQSVTLSNASGGGTWSTSNPTMVSVGSSSGIVTGLAGATYPTISYTSTGGCVSTYAMTVNALSSITGSSSVCQSQTIALSYLPTGTGWSSSTPAVASITSGGIVTGLTTGTATISFTTSGGCVATKVVAVITGSPIAGPSSVCNTQSVTLTNATGGGTWTTSNPSLATVGAASGIVTGIAGNTYPIISYTTSGGCLSTYAMTVNALSPITGLGPVCQTQTITASYLPAGPNWSSSATAVATIGTTGVITGVAPGTTIISYTTTNGCVATGIVTVNGFGAISGPASVCNGRTVTLTASIPGGTWSTSNPSLATVVAATGVVTGVAGATYPIISYTLSGGCVSTYAMTVNALSSISGLGPVCQTQTITASYLPVGPNWSSSATAVATIGTTGVITGVAPGTSIISYTTSNGCVATGIVTVNGFGTITGSRSVCNGRSVTLTSSVVGGTWSTVNTTMATVGSSSGVVSGVAGGTFPIISYTLPGGCRSTYSMTVNALGSISIATSVCQGATTVASYTTGSGTWSTSASGVATIGTTGTVTGIAGGTASISYTLANGCIAFTPILVNPISNIAGPTSVCRNSTITLTNATPGGSWSTPANIVAVVAATGVVTGQLATYLTSVSYTMPSGCKVGYAVTVNALPTAPGTITGPSSVSVSGSTITLGCTPSGGSWSSSNAAKATVNPATGVVTGVATGSAIITYTVSNASGCTNYNTKVITVGPMPPPHAATNNTVTTSMGNTITLQEALAGGIWNLISGDDIISLDNTTGKVTGLTSGRALVDYEVYDEQGNHTNITEVIVTPSSLTVNGINESGNVMIMPNPNSGTFTVKGSLATLPTGDAIIEVVNMLGQTVYSTKVALKDGTINEQVILGSALANGRYILNLRNGEEKHTFRFVLER